MSEDASVPIPLSAALPRVTKPRRKRRWFRRFVYFSLFISIATALLIWFAPVIIAKTELRNTVAKKVLNKLNGSATIGSAQLSWFGPVELNDIRVNDSTGQAVLTAARMTSSRTLYELLTQDDDLGTFTLDQLVVHGHVQKKTTNIEQLLEKYLQDDGSPDKPERQGLVLEARQGTLHLKDRDDARIQTISAVDLLVKIPRPRSEAISIQVNGETPNDPAKGTLRIDAAILKGGKVSISAERYPVESLNAILHRFSEDTDAHGRLSGKLETDWGRTEKEERRMTLKGWAEALELRVRGPSWLGPDELRLQHLAFGTKELPVSIERLGQKIQANAVAIQSDLGNASASGTLDASGSWESLLNQTGLKVQGTLDVAKLGSIFPGLLRIREGTEFRSGKITFDLASVAEERGPLWRGTLDTTALEAVRNSKNLIWEKPLKLGFAVRLAENQQPTFEDFTLQSDFIGLRARGELNDFMARAVVDLGKLGSHLADFLDLDGATLSGMANLDITTKPRPTGGFQIDAKAELTELAVLDKNQLGLREPKLTLLLKAEGQLNAEQQLRLETGTVNVSANADQLVVAIREPLLDVVQAQAGKASLTISGDMDRWRQRAGSFIDWPKNWELRGTGSLTADVGLSAEAFTANNVSANLQNAKFTGGGLDLNESEFVATGILRFDRKSQALTATDATISCPTIGASSRLVELAKAKNGEYGLVTTMKMQANLNRLQRTLRLQTRPEDAIGGKARGTLTLDLSQPDRIAFSSPDLVVENLVIGSERDPSWTEAKLEVNGKGQYDLKTDSLGIESLGMNREGFAATAKGQIGKLSSSVDLDLNGTVTYDLAKLEGKLKNYLGKGATAAGQDTKPFRIAGNFLDGGKNLTVAVGAPGSKTNLAGLNGNAAVAWKSIKAYGFDMGQAELQAKLDKGIVTMNPVEATFGGGKVRVHPTLSLNPGAYDLTFAKGTIVEKANLTPTVLTEALGYALPAIANAAQASGTLSFDLEENRIPLAAPERGQLKGRLTIHEASVSGGPVISQIITLLGVKNTSLNLASNQVVPIEFIDGRVTHKNFSITIDTVTIRSSGSVGLDGKMQLVFEVPLTEKILGPIGILKDRPLIREALAKQVVTIPVGGTISNPQLDPRAFQQTVSRIADNAIRDAGKGALEGVIKGGLDKLPLPFPLFPKKP